MEGKPDEENVTSSLKSNFENEEDTSKSVVSLKKRSFVYKWENSPFLAVRISYKVLHSIWIVVMAIGMFLAWLIAILAT